LLPVTIQEVRMKIGCIIFGHEDHFSGKKGSVKHHTGYDGEWFCLRCGKVLQKGY